MPMWNPIETTDTRKAFDSEIEASAQAHVITVRQFTIIHIANVIVPHPQEKDIHQNILHPLVT